MRKYYFSLVIAFFTFVSSAHAVDITNWDFSILNLQNSERIEIAYQSQGCWHNTASTIVIEGESAYTTSYEKNYEKHEGKSAQHELSWKEKEGLDRYLKRLAAGAPGGCTTTDTIQLVFKRNGQIVSTHGLVDATCGRVADEYTVGALLYDINKQQETSAWTDK